MLLFRSRLVHCGFLFLFASLLAFGSCSSASGPAFSAASMTSANECGIYLYRRGAIAAYGQKFTVLVDGRQAGFLANASYLHLPLTPGSHLVQVAPGGIASPSSLRIDATAGSRQFYEFVFPTGLAMRPSFPGAAIEARAEPEALARLHGPRLM